MFKTNKFTKTTALALASTMLVSSLGTTVTASAHDRRHPEAHGADHYNWNKHTHRQFHRTYGHGYEGEENYKYQNKRHYQKDYEYGYKQQQQHSHQSHKDKKRAKRAAIAIGIIGLAAGAIIATQAAKNKNATNHGAYRAPTPQPTYQYQEPQRKRFDQLSNTGEPNVVTFRDTGSLEPWTPGWQEWCANRYRSFNPNTGTFRGFDGLDHFCVPK